MRLGWIVVVLMGAWACGGDTPAHVDDPCGAASQILSEALDDAVARAPACTSDSDCVVMSDSAGCESIVIEACGMAVHRKTLELYDRMAVDERICDVAEASGLGCSIQASCAETGDPVCRKGVCTFVF